MWFPEIDSSEWSRLLDDIESSINSVVAESKVAILYGADSDGFISFLFLKRILEHIGASIVYQKSYLTFEYRFDKFMFDSDFDHIFCLDVPAIQEIERIRAHHRNAKITIIDHHQFDNTVNVGNRVEYFNPIDRNIEAKQRIPVCLMIQKVVESMGVTNSCDRILLSAGLQGDSALRDYPSLIHVLKELDGIDVERQRPLDSDIGALTKSITAWFQLNPGQEDFISLSSINRRSDLLRLIRGSDENQLLKNITNQFEDSVETELNLAETRYSRGSLFLIYKLTLDKFVSNIVCRRLSLQHRRFICVVEYSIEDISQFEFRYSGEKSVNIPEIIEYSGLGKLCQSFGGHPTASGAIVSRGERDEFIDGLLGFERVA